MRSFGSGIVASAAQRSLQVTKELRMARASPALYLIPSQLSFGVLRQRLFVTCMGRLAQSSRVHKGSLISAVLLLSSCANGSAAPLAPCTAPISVYAGTGQNARFEWTPRCGLFAINVLAPPTGGNVGQQGWTVLSETALIPPRIRHGEAPPGTRLVVPAFQVTPGVGYLVAFTAQSGQPPIATIMWTP